MQVQKNSIDLSVNLQALLRKEEDVWVAWCPAIDLASQGETQELAFKALEEAIQLWFDDCLERGVLREALKEVGFRPVSMPEKSARNMVSIKETVELIPVQGATAQIEKDIHVSVPAYVAAALMPGANHAAN